MRMSVIALSDVVFTSGPTEIRHRERLRTMRLELKDSTVEDFMKVLAEEGGAWSVAAARSLDREPVPEIYVPHAQAPEMMGGRIFRSLSVLVDERVDPAYLERYATELPRSFNPGRFEPREWARLARLAGFTYVVFTAKHHNGFCMWDTKTSTFNIMNSGYGKDILKEIIHRFGFNTVEKIYELFSVIE